MTSREHLAVALDTDDWGTFSHWCELFGPNVGVLKVGLEAFLRWGPPAIAEARRTGARVFFDAKLHDIPNTVAGAVRAARDMGIDLLTVHAAGGTAMMEAAVEAASAEVEILGVTLLTHLDQLALERLDLPGPSEQRVAHWARLAWEAGCSGVVSSPLEAAALRKALPPPFLLVTPGIRPPAPAGGQGKSDDQRRVATPARALRDGSDLLVVGRPLTRAEDPGRAVRDLLVEMERAVSGDAERERS